MSLVEDAKKLAEDGWLYDGDCGGCDGTDDGYEHTLDCPWLSLPRIVIALEAAERAAAEKEQSTHPDALWVALDELVAALAEPPGGVEED